MPLDAQTLCKYRLERAEEDFFVVAKEDSAVQLKNAEIFLKMVKEYLQKKEQNWQNS